MAECRWCHRRITPMASAWVDDDGLFNCGKHRRHWPVEPVAIALPESTDA